MTNYTALPKSYKHAYPFKLGTTSFIYPDGYVPNVKMLGPYMDEIELLFFESSEESLPSKREAETLAQLGKEFDLTYNVHLPTDISLTESDPRERWRAVEAIRYIIDITSPLSPSTYTLHLPDEHNFRTKADLEQWQETAYKNMEHLLSEVEALTADPSLLSVETLKYPFEWVGKIITDFSLSVCMDIGHLILCGSDVEAVFRQYSEVIPVIHLHGVENGRDHVALDRLSEKQTALVMSILEPIQGVGVIGGLFL